jgi:ABC-type bacteriocin/lantibiotic exporter with double-glycine peptidase domain
MKDAMKHNTTDSIKGRAQRDQEKARQAEEALYRALQGAGEEAAAGGGIAAALGVILSKFKVEAVFPEEEQSLEAVFDSVLEPLGIMYEFAALDPGWQHHAFDYMVGFTREGQAVALLPAVGGYRCAFGDGRVRYIRNRDDFLLGQAVCIHRPFPPQPFTTGAFVGYLLKLFSPRDILPIAAASALIALLGMVVPALYNLVLGTLVPMGDAGMESLWFFACFFLVTSLASAVIQTVRFMLLSALTVRITGEAQTAIMARILLLPDRFFRDNTAGRLTTRLADGKRLASILISVVVDTSFTAIFSLVYLPQMVSYAPALVAPALIILLAGTGVSFLTGFAGIRKERRSIAAVTELHSFNYAALRGIQKIKNTGAENRAFVKWAGLYKEKMRQMYNPSPLVMVGDLLMTAIASAGVVVLLSAAAGAGVSAASYIAFYTAYSMVSAGFSEFLNVVNSMMLIDPLAEQMRPIFSARPEQTAAFTALSDPAGDIAVEGVSFRYEPGMPRVLKDLSFHVRAGECLGIVGESGCGKSTLLRLLMGFESPEAGIIRYDGQALDSLDKRALRKHFGVVLQNSRILPGTIFTNIAFNSPWLTEEAAWQAAEKAQIADFIRGLPQAMDTPLSEASGGLSGGQKQGVLLARALAAGPSVILLDEATSAMDNVTQRGVLDALEKMAATRIIVAQRLSTVAGCDKILVIADGAVAEGGTWEALMRADGLFAAMVRRQIL